VRSSLFLACVERYLSHSFLVVESLPRILAIVPPTLFPSTFLRCQAPTVILYLHFMVSFQRLQFFSTSDFPYNFRVHFFSRFPDTQYFSALATDRAVPHMWPLFGDPANIVSRFMVFLDLQILPTFSGSLFLAIVLARFEVFAFPLSPRSVFL